MPLSPLIIFYGPDGKPLPGPVTVSDPEVSDLSGCYGEEFRHCVYTIQKDYFYALLYGVDFVRRHEPLTIVKQLDKMSIPLMNYLANGTFLQKVEIRWFQYNKKRGRTEEYFRMTLEHVRLHSITYLMPDVKDSIFERYGHCEKVQLIYQKITWLCPKGHLTYTDIWNEAFGEFDQKDFFDETEAMEDPSEMPLVEPLKLKFIAGTFEEPKDGFQFDAKATVTFTFESNRKPDNKENKVYAKLFAVYNGKTEDMRLTNEGRLVNDGSWSTEFKLKKPEKYSKEEPSVEYFVTIENQATGAVFRSESITLPSDTQLIPKFISVHFEDEKGERIDQMAKDRKVYLVMASRNMRGKMVDIDLSDSTIDFEYKGKICSNDWLERIEVTADMMRIELVTRAKGQK